MVDPKPIELKPVIYVAKCDCGGEYEYTGRVLLSNPPKYVHKCNRCNLPVNLNRISPHICYEQKESENGNV